MGEAKRRGAVLDGRKGSRSRADLFTAKRLNRRHAERDGRGKEGIVFPPPRRPSRWMTVVRPVVRVCPGGFYYVPLPHSLSLATLQVSRRNSIAMTFEN